MKDKPTKGPDPYHTAYGLSGCSFAQHKSDFQNLHANTPHSIAFTEKFDGNYANQDWESTTEDPAEKEFRHTSMLAGILDNKLRRFHPIFNARFDYVAKAKSFFRQ